MFKGLLICSLLTIVSTAWAQKGSKAFDPAKTYVIESKLSRKLVSAPENVGLMQWEHNNVGERWWKIQKNSDNTVTLICKANGMAVQSGNATDSAAFLFVAPVNNQDNQKWEMRYLEHGEYAIISKHSKQALDIMEATFFNGACILQWPYTGTLQQKWTVVPGYDEYVFIRSVLNGKVLTSCNKNTVNGADVAQWENTGALWQQWAIVPVENNLYKIINKLSGKALQVSQGLYSQPGNAELHHFNGLPNQLWSIVPVEGNFVKIESAFSGFVLDINSLNNLNGAHIMEYEWNSGANQQFLIKEISK